MLATDAHRTRTIANMMPLAPKSPSAHAPLWRLAMAPREHVGIDPSAGVFGHGPEPRCHRQGSGHGVRARTALGARNVAGRSALGKLTLAGGAARGLTRRRWSARFPIACLNADQDEVVEVWPTRSTAIGVVSGGCLSSLLTRGHVPEVADMLRAGKIHPKHEPKNRLQDAPPAYALSVCPCTTTRLS